MKFNSFKIAILLLALPFFSKCSKNNPNTVIPNVYVEVQLNINEPSSFNLQPIGGWIYYAGGSNGLIIYHANADEFKCYDRHSTYNVDDWCQVNVDSTGFKLIDTCSASEFSIFDGSVIKAPATIPLKQYPTTFDGTFIIIRN
jgi:hypothetical protein